MAPNYKTKLGESVQLVEVLAKELNSVKAREVRVVSSTVAFVQAVQGLLSKIILESKNQGVPLPKFNGKRITDSMWRAELDDAIHVVSVVTSLIPLISANKGSTLMDEEDERIVNDIWERLGSINKMNPQSDSGFTALTEAYKALSATATNSASTLTVDLKRRNRAASASSSPPREAQRPKDSSATIVDRHNNNVDEVNNFNNNHPLQHKKSNSSISQRIKNAVSPFPDELREVPRQQRSASHSASSGERGPQRFEDMTLDDSKK